MPITSIELSGAISPTSAATFRCADVETDDEILVGPFSHKVSHLSCRPRDCRLRRADRRRASRCKTVRVSHVDVVDVAGVAGDLVDAGGDEALEALVDLAAAEPHGDAVVEIEFPGAAQIQPYGREAHARLDELALRREIAPRNFASLPCGPESRGNSGGMCRASEMNSSPRVFSRPFAPQRAAATCSTTRMLSARGQRRSTVALSTHGSCSTARRTAARSTEMSPTSRTRALTACSTSTGETRWKRPGDRHLRDVLVERAQRERGRDRQHRDAQSGDADPRQQPGADARARFIAAVHLLVLGLAEDHVLILVRLKLVSSTCHTSCSKLIPRAPAALGTRL
jgi:hypothetical protein